MQFTKREKLEKPGLLGARYKFHQRKGTGNGQRAKGNGRMEFPVAASLLCPARLSYAPTSISGLALGGVKIPTKRCLLFPIPYQEFPVN